MHTNFMSFILYQRSIAMLLFFMSLRIFPYETKPLFPSLKSKKGTFGQHIIHFALTG